MIHEWIDLVSSLQLLPRVMDQPNKSADWICKLEHLEQTENDAQCFVMKNNIIIFTDLFHLMNTYCIDMDWCFASLSKLYNLPYHSMNFRDFSRSHRKYFRECYNSPPECLHITKNKIWTKIKIHEIIKSMSYFKWFFFFLNKGSLSCQLHLPSL